VLSYELWQSRLGGQDDVVGRVVALAGQPTIVVGVMPPGFALHVPQNDLIYVGLQELWVPFRLDPSLYAAGEGPSIAVFGELVTGTTPDGAQAELSNLGAVLAANGPRTSAGVTTRMATFSNPFGGLDRGIGIRGAMSLMALFIAIVIVGLCANVALLLYARAATREGEFVMRSALGASRARIVSQLFAEALGLAAVALGVGWIGASIGLGWLVNTVTAVGIAEGVSQPPIEAALAPRTMAYAAALAIAGTVVAGVLPGVKMTGRRGGRFSSRGSVSELGGTWAAITVLQVALTATLVPIGIVIGMQTRETLTLDRGFSAEDYLAVRLEMDRELSSTGASILADQDFRALLENHYQELARRIRADAGVVGVTVGQLPGFDHQLRIPEIEGTGAGESETIGARVQVASVDPTFFDVLGLRLISGRAFGVRDQVEDARSVIVNESFVRDRLGGGSAVGRRLRYLTPATLDRPDPENGEPWMEIVGVVSDVVMSVDPSLASQAGVYHPRVPATSDRLRIAVHVPGAPANYAGRLRELAAQTSPALRVYHPLTLDRAGGGALAIYGLVLKIIMTVGGFALLLTNAGIYAVTSFSVSRRTREIGVRLALGAERRDVVSTTLSRTSRRVAIGVLLGSVPGVFLTSLLTDVSMRPSASALGLAVGYFALLIAVCMAACIVPMRRALGIQPAEALVGEG
jgi:predicted permease